MPDRQDQPLITFYQIYPSAPAPRRADPGLFGSMPARAYHYCEPFTTASGFGWHVFPPLDFDLIWDGTLVRWRTAGSAEWSLLERADLPGLRGLWKLTAPVSDILPAPVSFMDAPRGEAGIVQIWSGMLARTRPEWAILMRGPANLPRDPSYEVLEGIIETDWLFAPVMSNIRLCRTDTPIPFRTTTPLFQVQPVLKAAYAEESLGSMTHVKGIAALSDEDWEAYKAYMIPRNMPGIKPGWYKAEVRRRGRRTRETAPSPGMGVAE